MIWHAEGVRERILEMVSFESDYITGAHPEILKRLIETNMEAESGYGLDRFSESAKEKIRAACACPDAEVEFLVGGTQTNSVIISTMLADWQGVVAAATGHVSMHEAGAIEYSGHEVMEIPQKDGKIDAVTLRNFLKDVYADGNLEHMMYPGMVYISHPTEYGTLYTKKELEDIAAVCHQYELPLFMDGARLGYGVMSRDTDVTLEDVARICDVFYIGGTKVGALCGEAVVYTRKNRPQHFTHSIKKRGALLAKGRLIGVQFDALFTDDLYFRISRHAIGMAERMKGMFVSHGLEFYLDSPTNQQFVILENGRLRRLQEKVAVSFWEKYDENRTVVRFAASWSTTQEDLDILEMALSA